MSRLHIVVAHCLHVVAHEVVHRCGNVLSVGLHIVIIGHDGLALQHVSRIHKQQTVAVDVAQRVDVCRHAGERPVGWLLVYEVEWKEASVHIGRLDHSYLHRLAGFAPCVAAC